MTRPQPLLEVDGLSVGYGIVPVIEEITLQVGRGEAVALLGANGAGKSTLLKAVSGLLVPGAGSIRFDGRDLSRLRAEALVTLGLSHVAEGRRIFRRETVLDNLLLGLYRLRLARAETAARVEEALAMFPALRQKADQLAGSLSGGQQQMLAIAQALVRKPRLLMLDEPSLGLAPNLVEEVFRTLAAVRAQGVSILLVEQVVERALEFADHAYLLQSGRLSGDGPAATLRGSEQVRRAYLGAAAAHAPS
ncbi:MAG: ABC transporter ATP-binding protein [Burkholderiales bacterium]|nr:ABC transporter ATP-binding protein [Burkholderiales bacterium]